MIREDIKKKDYLRILKSSKAGYIYNDNGRLIKFDKCFAHDMLKYKKIKTYYGEINIDQIYWLSSLRYKIKNSSLPEGILFYDHTPVGVLYPHYFEGYDILDNLFKEDSQLLLSNLRKSIINNIELTDNGIYNTDFALKNALYKNNNVELIDLDGKYIKSREQSSLNQVYSYFYVDMLDVIVKKLVRLYGIDETKRMIPELKKIIIRNELCNRESPLHIVDEVEKLRILK